MEGAVAGSNKRSRIVTGTPISPAVPFLSIKNHSSAQEDGDCTMCRSTGMLFSVCYINSFFRCSGAKIFSVPAANPPRTEKQGYLFLTKICMYQIVEKVEANHSQKSF